MSVPYRRRGWRYSAFDGTQQPYDVGVDEIMAGLTDDLLYHGDLQAALRHLLQEGINREGAPDVEGLRRMLERIRQRREEVASQRNELAERVEAALEEVVATERAALDQAESAARAETNPRIREAGRQSVAEQQAALDLLPSSLPGRIEQLMQYPFRSEAAHERFEELLDELRREMTQLQLDRAAAQMASATPEERAHLRAGLDALNRMLEQRREGEPVDPSFAEFMAEFGDLFPGNPADLDELLAQLAARMAAASQMIAGMTMEQRRQLDELMSGLMGDLDLSWQMDRLGANLRDLLPNLRWDEQLGPPGQDPLSVLGGSDAVAELAELNELESLLRQAHDPAGLAEIDLDRVRELLGPDASRSLDVLARLTRRLEAAGLVGRKGGRLQLTPAGLRQLGDRALTELFSKLRRDQLGNHPLLTPGIGIDRELETKPYEFGDPFQIDVEATLRNAINRAVAAGEGDGHRVELPVRLDIDDFAIERHEHLASASTVLAIDLSLSMPMRDNFLAAKKVAIALQALIASRYPRDYLGLVGFSATAREVRPEELPEVSWDFAYGTNLQHALALARRMLAPRHGAKQIIVITDGEPTAHVMDDGEVFFNYPPVPETIEATLLEVARCTRDRIRINSFVLDETGGLRSFVQKMTQLNRGRAFSTTPTDLGEYVLTDFVEHRAGARTRRIRRAG